MYMINSSGNGYVVTVDGAISVKDHLPECVVDLFSVKKCETLKATWFL